MTLMVELHEMSITALYEKKIVHISSPSRFAMLPDDDKLSLIMVH